MNPIYSIYALLCLLHAYASLIYSKMVFQQTAGRISYLICQSSCGEETNNKGEQGINPQQQQRPSRISICVYDVSLFSGH